MNKHGDVVISRFYRGDVPADVADTFAEKVIRRKNTASAPPVLYINGFSFAYMKHKDMYFVGIAKANANVAMLFQFLKNLASIFAAYFDDAQRKLAWDQASIQENFTLVYELLDEVMDYGYPQSTESKILKEYITLSANRAEKQLAPPSTVTNAVSWRSPGIKHRKNEIFLDVVESLDLLVSSNGTVLHSEILGAVKMRSYLSGMPELKLGLNDKVMFQSSGRKSSKSKSVDLEDIKFHQCVRLARFENDRTISFIPPDGEFDLMTYRLSTHVKPLIWVESIIEPHSGRIEYMIKAKSQFKARSIANGVKIRIPVPPDVDSPSFKTAIGNVTYIPDQDCIVWSIKQFYGAREYLMRAHFGLPSVSAATTDEDRENWKAPIKVSFEIPYFTVSGIQVRYLKIIEKSGYQALPWVRYITKNGKYELRIT